jgi:membrane-bound lytic murein transglycosylase MltF
MMGILRSRRVLGRALVSTLGFAALTLTAGGCKEPSSKQDGVPATPGSTATSAATPASAEATPLDEAPSDDAIAEALQPFHGDLSAMQERRRIRMLVPFSRTNYFLDKGRQIGVTAEAGHALEEFVNKQLKTGNLLVHVAFVPVRREVILKQLEQGLGDIAAANLTITESRRALADFSTPLARDVNEVVVTPRGAPAISSPEELSGRDVYVRRTSSYFESLSRLNATLKNNGKAPVTIVEADEQLEDEDILEMVNAGLVPATVVDEHIANLWSQVFDQIDVHPDVSLRTEGEIAWAIRKDAPELKALVNRFITTYGRGTTFGNVLFKKYFGNAQYLKRSASPEQQRKFRALVKYFQRYGTQYDLPYLLLAAQGYQESQLDQSRRSSAGAVGVMQIKPSTAEGSPVFIKGVDRDVEKNIQAGAKYLRWIVDEYYKDEPMTKVDKGLFALASYNAGAGRISALRRKAKKMGFDENKWFQNVEVVVARDIGRETVQYVGNIYKYYVAYDLIVRQGLATKPGVRSQD